MVEKKDSFTDLRLVDKLIKRLISVNSEDIDKSPWVDSSISILGKRGGGCKMKE